jgi:hypothetical protein
MRKTDLRTAAAYHFLGLSTTDYLVDVAHAALENGIYAHGLGEIATMRHPTLADVGPYFVSALSELQIQTPNWDQAIDRLTMSYMISLAEGAGTPREITSLVHKDVTRLHGGEGSLGSLAALVDHFFHYDHYDDPHYPTEHAILATLDRNCIALAWNWCHKRFLPVLESSWLTTTVVALAQGIDNDHAFDRLPILADALQDAGCDNADILDHCRGLGPHVRGCWVVDLLLGKE